MRDLRTGPIGQHRYPLVLQMISEGKTAPEIADTLNVNQETVRKFARKRGLQIVPHDQKGENHPSWKGGTTLDRSGYILVRVPKDGPHGYLIRALQKRGKNGEDSHGYAPEHRIVMHDKLQRKLQPGEVVDHIDGDVKNNHPDNLRVFANNKEHLQATLTGKKPKWSADGFARMCAPRGSYRKRASQHEPNATHPKTDGQASP